MKWGIKSINLKTPTILILSTVASNTFNFLAPNLSSGIYEIVVEAEIAVRGMPGPALLMLMPLFLGSLFVDEIRMIQ